MKTVAKIEANESIGADKIVSKVISEFTLEDIEEVYKNKKDVKILFHGLDRDMFENVINNI